MSLCFSLGKGVRSLFTDGLSTATERFLIGSTQTLSRFSFFFERVEGLLDRPEDMGFPLLGDPDPRVFDDVPPPPGPPPDPFEDPSPGTDPGGSGGGDGGDTVRPGELPAGCDPVEGSPQGRLERTEETLAAAEGLDAGTREELACLFAQLDGVRPAQLPGLIAALTGKDRGTARPLLRFVLLRHVFAHHHRLKPIHVDDLLGTYGAEALADQMYQSGVASIRSMVSPELLETPDPTAPATTPPPTATAVPELPDEEEHPPSTFEALYVKNLQYEACMSHIGRLQQDYMRYKRSSAGAVDGLDLAAMKENGFIREVPYCPGGGTYEVAGIDTVRCSLHGNPTVPWKTRRDYLKYFKSWEVARDALERDRPKEALFIIRKTLEKQPSHPWALELHGDATFALERYKEAAQSFYTLTEEVWSSDAYALFHAGMAFYASGNLPLADKSFSMLLTSSTYESSRRRYPTRFEYYRVRERAQWMLDEFLRPRAEDGTPLDPVRFLEFQVAREPEWQVERCRDLTGAARDTLYEFLTGYYSSPVLQRLSEELRQEESALARLAPYEVGDRERIEVRIQEIEAKIARFRKDEGHASTGNLIRDLAKRIRDVGLEAHEGANYRVTAAMELHCSVHPHILEDPSISQSLRLEDHELELLNTSLSYGILATQPDRRECFDRQEAIWSRLSLNPPGGYAPEQVAALLGLASAGEADCPHPSTDGGYRIRVLEGVRHLSCRTHGDREVFLDPLRGRPDEEGP